MSIENVIEKLNCATRCNPNATQVLIGEAIEMLAKVKDEIGLLHQVVDDTKLDKEYQDVLSVVMAERDEANRIAESLSIIGIGLQKDKDALLAEREQWMKQEPVGVIDAYDNDLMMVHFVEFYPNTKFSIGDKVFLHPLPAQQDDILNLGMNQPASMRRCVEKLIEAAEILLDDKNYDGTGHELISDARSNAIKYLSEHKPYKHPPKEWLQAVEEFVRRCEAGEIQSRYTYKKFKALLLDLED